MTVPAGAARVSYIIDGTEYAVPFYFLQDEDLRVLLRASDGTESEPTLGVDYSVSGADNPAGGTVTFGEEPSGVSLVIIRDPGIEQPTDYPEGGRFPAASHERALDRLTMIAQRLDDKIARALVIDDTDPNPPPSPTVIATVAGIESQIVTLGALSSEITTLSGISADISTVAGVSSDVTTLAGISAQITAVAANESNITAVAGNAAGISTVAENIEAVQGVKDALDASVASGISIDDIPALGLAPADLNVQKAIEAVASRGGKELGEVFFVWDHIDGVEPPDNDEGEYIRLTAGQSGSGGYNEGLLTNESVSGSAPLVEATAEIATGPLQGQTVPLINTMEAFLRARETSGVLQMDQMQKITGSFEAGSDLDGIANTSDGAFSIFGGTGRREGGAGSTNQTGVSFDSADSPDARASSTTSGETRSKNVSGTAYMRIA